MQSLDLYKQAIAGLVFFSYLCIRAASLLKEMQKP